MSQIQEDFLTELKSNKKFSVKEYAELYNKYRMIAIEDEENKSADKIRARAMGNYYTVTTLSNFINNENKLSRIIAFAESI
jgi:nicotinic acid mononucleotide adenylyltransferase